MLWAPQPVLLPGLQPGGLEPWFQPPLAPPRSPPCSPCLANAGAVIPAPITTAAISAAATTLLAITLPSTIILLIAKRLAIARCSVQPGARAGPAGSALPSTTGCTPLPTAETHCDHGTGYAGQCACHAHPLNSR